MMLVLVSLITGLYPAVTAAQTCPPEVAEARKAITTVTVAQTTAKAPPRALASARTKQSQAARSQEVQAARGQEVQAARGQEVQAARSKQAQAARAESVTQARRLVQQAESACKQNDAPRASAHANAAMELLKYLQAP